MIAEKVQEIRRRMAQAALAAGRRPEEILLCAATKMNDAERVRQAVAAVHSKRTLKMMISEIVGIAEFPRLT